MTEFASCRALPPLRGRVWCGWYGWCLGLLLGLWLFCGLASAQPPLRLDRLPDGPLGPWALYLQEQQGARLSLAQAQAALRDGAFRPDPRAIASFGLGARPVWVHLVLENPLDVPLAYRLAAGMSWIDRLEVQQLQGERLLGSWHSGDGVDAVDGPATVVPGLGYVFPLWLPPGRSEVFIRAETPDPLVLPMTLEPASRAATSERDVHYGYGLLYGFLLALIAYNLMLYSGLRAGSYLYYAIYLLSFIALNLSYTGHGDAWWWSGEARLQRYLIPVLMLVFGVCGFLFAGHFLALHRRAARLRRWLRGVSLAALLLMTALVVLDLHLAAIRLAFVFLLVFVFGMVWLGLSTAGRRSPAGRYFLAAALCGMGGAGLTVMAVWGWLPLNSLSFHGAELGILLEATLLALALASQMRGHELARHRAEQLAGTDALTGLFNRRAALERAEGLWNTAQRRERPLSVVMLDIDHFKAINDRHGHAGGDRTLVQVAGLLRQTCRAGDVLARWGGEEFLLLLPETDLPQALALAERLRHSVEHSVPGLSISLGVAQRVAPQSLEQLIEQADRRLYQAKGSGRNRVVGATAPA